MDARQILAFRLARSGLASQAARTPAEAAACPASDYSRDAALVALAARGETTGGGSDPHPARGEGLTLTRGLYLAAIEAGELVVAHAPRGAIHALAPEDAGLYGAALISSDDEELGAQLGRQFQLLAAEHGFAPTHALAEVAESTSDALAGGRALGKNELHEQLRARVREELMPWCKGCASHHVAPMLWRYATVRAGARLDVERRYFLGPGGDTPPAEDAVRRFLSFYGPSTTAAFAEWAGVARSHALRLWGAVEHELAEVAVDGRPAFARNEDLADLESPPLAAGVRLIPPGDPYLQKPNRPLLAPEPELRKRLFRPVGSPGAVLRDGELAGLWKARLKGRKLEITVELLARVSRTALAEAAQRLATLRGASEAVLLV